MNNAPVGGVKRRRKKSIRLIDLSGSRKSDNEKKATKEIRVLSSPADD